MQSLRMILTRLVGLLLLASIHFGLVSPAKATVVPITIRLSSSTGANSALRSYSIPSEKVFILQSVVSSAPSGNPPPKTEIRVDFQATNYPAGGTTSLTIEIAADFISNRLVQLTNPFPIQSGATLYHPNSTGTVGTERYIYLFGLLADESDLFASVPAKFENITKGPYSLDAALQISSPRKVRNYVEVSTDLNIWNPANAQITKGAGSGQYYVSVPDFGSPKLFMRARSVAKPKN